MSALLAAQQLSGVQAVGAVGTAILLPLFVRALIRGELR